MMSTTACGTVAASAFLIILIFTEIQGAVDYWKFVGNYRLNLKNSPYYFKLNCYQGVDMLNPNQDVNSLVGALHLVNREMSFTRNLLVLNFQLSKCDNIFEGGENLRISDRETEYKIGYKKQLPNDPKATYIVFTVPKKEQVGNIFETSTEDRMIGQSTDDSWAQMFRYKLYAFKDQQEVETVRFLLSYISSDWEDVRLDPYSDQWKHLKAYIPLGKLPLLEFNGKRILSLEAIVTHLAARGGLDAYDEEAQQRDAIAAVLRDLWQMMKTIQTEIDEGKKTNLKKNFVEETLPTYFKFLDETALSHEEFLAYERLSWVDFHFTALAEALSSALGIADVTSGYPHLRDLRLKVLNLPQIKNWMAKRPKVQSTSSSSGIPTPPANPNKPKKTDADGAL